MNDFRVHDVGTFSNDCSRGYDTNLGDNEKWEEQHLAHLTARDYVQDSKNGPGGAMAREERLGVALQIHRVKTNLVLWPPYQFIKRHYEQIPEVPITVRTPGQETVLSSSLLVLVRDGEK